MKKTTSIALAGLALILFIGAGSCHQPLIRERMDSGLGSVELLENAPPLLVFTTLVLGGFRGILADILWLRSAILQDEGKYFELMQLSDWITKLEPRVPEVWSFQAWNITYNISVMMPEIKDRWRWVQNGIRLLRDEGLLYNPESPAIYQEIAWIFSNKIGGSTDAAHLYYKQAWATLMNDLLGSRMVPDYTTIRNHPDTLRRLEEDFKLDPDTMELIDKTYGPLDWRLAYSHAIYWAFRGIQNAGKQGHLPCERILYHSLGDLFRNGRLTFDPGNHVFSTGPDIRLLPGVLKALDQTLARFPEVSVEAGYVTFLEKAIPLLHQQGETEQARNLFHLLHEKFPDVEKEKDFDRFIIRKDSTPVRRIQP